MPEPVSLADTIRRLRWARVPCPEPGCTGSYVAVKVHADGIGATAPCPGCRGRGSVPDPAFDAAVDTLLAVGERDKAEIAELRGELAVAYGRPDSDGKQREWFSALDRAKAEAEDLRAAGERDRRQIARLAEALERIRRWRFEWDGVVRTDAKQREFARAVLAGEENVPPHFFGEQGIRPEPNHTWPLAGEEDADGN